MKELNITISTSSTTAVRGWSNNTLGFKITQDSPESISLRGYGTKTFISIVEKIKESGFKVKDLDPPSGGNLTGSSEYITSTIRLEKYYNKEGKHE